MATIKTHDLIKCNRIYPTLPSVNNAGLSTYNGLFVELDGDPKKSYKVRKNVQGRFLHPSDPIFAEDIASGVIYSYSITSMKFNGVEVLTAPANYTLTQSNAVFGYFPFYLVGSEYDYTGNVANGVAVDVDVTGTLGLGTTNFYEFLGTVIGAYDLPVKVSRSPGLWWAVDGKPRLYNFILEKYYDDNFEFTMSEIVTPAVGSPTLTTNRYVFNGETVVHYKNGVDITIIEANTTWPQFSDENSFLSYDFDFDSIIEIVKCPVFEPFNTSLLTDGCANISVSCDCSKMTFSDNSNYLTNGLPGHDPELFTSRTIVIKKPDGSTYVLGTSDVADVDQVIQPHYSSSNQFSYSFTSSDVDGIYEVMLCSYPDWSSEVMYESFTQTIVRRNGKLYKAVVSNSNLDPSNPANGSYWTEYTCDVDCDNTRYCTTQKIVVLCISLLNCYKSLVKNAFCDIQKNPCKSMCDNPEFMKAMKFRVTLDALEFAVCANSWADAQSHIDILKSICCCNV